VGFVTKLILFPEKYMYIYNIYIFIYLYIYKYIYLYIYICKSWPNCPPPSKESQISHLHPQQLYYPYGKEHTMKCMMKTGK